MPTKFICVADGQIIPMITPRDTRGLATATGTEGLAPASIETTPPHAAPGQVPAGSRHLPHQARHPGKMRPHRA